MAGNDLNERNLEATLTVLSETTGNVLFTSSNMGMVVQ